MVISSPGTGVVQIDDTLHIRQAVSVPSQPADSTASATSTGQTGQTGNRPICFRSDAASLTNYQVVSGTTTVTH